MLYQTHAVVHLGNIRRNIEGLWDRVGRHREVLLAVKANGYGHGAVPIAKLAARIGVAWLGVATVPEGIELRAAGCDLRILKFSPAFPEEMAAAVQHDLALAVAARENLEMLDATAKHCGRRVKVHLKIDTGMGRIGCTPADAPVLAALIRQRLPHLELEGVMTHLPVSDEPDSDFTRRQLERFAAAVREVEAAIDDKVRYVHAANSGGILGYEESWLNLVRPGIMIYGFRPGPATPATVPLLPGLSMFTRVSFVKTVAAGTPIGYGGTWVAPRETRIATIPAGYADGFNRLFSNRGRVLIGGRSYPLVGRVCMDQSMVDLGPSVAGGVSVAVGDRVTLIGRDGGEEITVEEWARQLGTITYEVTCQLNPRVVRYYEEDPA